MKLAVILFPGSNDHENSKRAAEAAGIPTDIVRWNDLDKIKDYDGYLLPGGWSYEDRIRAGVIAAKDPVMEIIKKEAAKGKPVIGICNGAQILVECGMVPGYSVEMALAPNKNPWIDGYYCTWTRIKAARDCAFIKKGTILRIPVAHGEGRYTSKTPDVTDDRIVFQFCDEKGNINEKFPYTPNGSIFAIAGICNEAGNILSMMPHPERSSWMHQVPGEPNSMEAGPCRVIFENMKKYMEGRQ